MNRYFSALFSGAACSFLACAVSAATISGFTVTGNEAKLTITYSLDAAAFVTGDILVDDESLGAETGDFVGTVNMKVSAGKQTAYWFPRASIPGRSIAANKLKVRLSVRALTDPPPYLVTDLTRAQPELKYYESSNAVPEGVTAKRYKLDRILLRRIPAKGESFQMGATGDQRTVTLTNDFWMGVYPVTQRQYYMVRRVQNATKATPPEFTDSEDSAMRPVNNVSFSDLQGWQCFNNNGREYKAWKEGPDTSHFFYAWRTIFTDVPMDLYMPTEAQWEFACRGGNTADYFADVDKIAWHAGNSNGETHPVGLKLPNGYGLYDMQGNVREATLDGWKSDLGTEPATDPFTAWTDGSNRCTYRGGSYADDADACKASSRFSSPGSWGGSYSTRDTKLGVRICSTIWTSTTGTKVDYTATLATALDTRGQDEDSATILTFDSGFILREVSNECDLAGVTPGLLLFVK